MGSGPKVKYGANVGSPLARAVIDAAGGQTATVLALNAAHQDSGLFGVVISCEPQVAGQVRNTHISALWFSFCSPSLTNFYPVRLRRQL